MSGSGISWAICKSASRSRQITTPAAHHSLFLQAGCPSCSPTNSVKALKQTHYSRHLTERTRCVCVCVCTDDWWRVNIRRWQRCPMNCAGHLHVKFLWSVVSEHVPPCRHGFLVHGSTAHTPTHTHTHTPCAFS